MNRTELAVKYFADNYLCSQAVFAAFATQYGLTEEQALKIAACFGSGMCKGEVCGAVTGALMAIGLKYGHCRPDDVDRKIKTNDLTRQFMDRFQEENGSCLCKELLGYDLSIREDAMLAREAGLFADFCPKMVASAAQILEDILNQE